MGIDGTLYNLNGALNGYRWHTLELVWGSECILMAHVKHATFHYIVY